MTEHNRRMAAIEADERRWRLFVSPLIAGTFYSFLGGGIGFVRGKIGGAWAPRISGDRLIDSVILCGIIAFALGFISRLLIGAMRGPQVKNRKF